jgi:hypothetical protein
MTPAPGNPPPPGAGPVAASGGDAGRWREAARLRHDHSGWTVIWLAPAAEFRAYRRLPRTRRDTALADPTADGLAAQITAAEQTTRPPRPARG